MSTKDFEKGIEAGAKPFQDKFEQHAKAIERVSNKVEAGIKNVTGVVDAVIEDISSIEKKRLYDLNTQYDIKTLEDYEKELLLAGLFTLAKEKANENQQSFIRSVKKYLDIKNPQTEIDLSGIENVENLAAQKAIYQIFAEFLFLEQEADSFLSEYEELFDLFSIKKKDRESIFHNILQIYRATGAQGICEKYGYVVDTGTSIFEEPPLDITPEVVKNDFTVSSGEEKTFYAKEIKISGKITCAGSLIFDHCVLIYNGDARTGNITLEEKGSITFTHCTIIGKNNDTPAESSNDYLISSYYVHRDGAYGCILIEHSLFYNCRFFLNADAEIAIQNCKFLYSKQQQTSPVIKAFLGRSKKTKMQNCLVENLDPAPPVSEGYGYLFEGIMTVDSCTFRNIVRCLKSEDGDENDETAVLNASAFFQCADVLSSFNAKITYCRFEDCETKLNFRRMLFFPMMDVLCQRGKLVLRDSQFIGCRNTILSAARTEIARCDFYNHRAETAPCFAFNDFRDSYVGSKKISNCLFDGISIQGAGGFRMLGDPVFVICSIDKGKRYGVVFEKCTFKHCVNKSGNQLIDTTEKQYGAFGSVKNIEVITINGCTGLDMVNKQDQGDQAVDMVIKEETPTGEPIGINTNECVAGVPGYDYGKK